MTYEALYDELYTNGYHEGGICHTKPLINEHLSKIVPVGSKILDVGCSTGNALQLLSGLGYVATGVDISKVAVKKCVSRGFNALYGKAESIPIPSRAVAAVTCTDVLEHVPRDMIDIAVREICRVCIHDGYIMLQVATVTEGNRSFDGIASKHGLKDLHVTCMSADEWLDVFNRWNLQVCHMNVQSTGFSTVLRNKINTSKLYYFNNRS